MTTQTKQFIVTVKARPKNKKRVTFFDVSQKSIIRKKRGQKRGLSEQVDQIVYGV